MPSKTGEEVLVTSLGELYRGLHEHRYWSSKRGRDRYPFPIGYQATRVHGGQEYCLEITEGPNGPDFVVIDHRGMRYVADSAVRAWSVALKGNGRAGHVKENADGGEIFGFTQPMVKKYLQDMVTKAGGVPDLSATPLSPLATNVATTSGRGSEILKSEERPSHRQQAASARGKGKHKKRDLQAARSPLMKVDIPAASSAEEMPVGRKRQKLGDPKSPDKSSHKGPEVPKKVLKPAMSHGESKAPLDREDVGKRDEQARGEHKDSQELANEAGRNRKRVDKAAKLLLERRAALKEVLCANRAALAATRTLKRPRLNHTETVPGTTGNLPKPIQKPQDELLKQDVQVREATGNNGGSTYEKESGGRGVMSPEEAVKGANKRRGEEGPSDAAKNVQQMKRAGKRGKEKKEERAESAGVGAAATTNNSPTAERKQKVACAEVESFRVSAEVGDRDVQPDVLLPDEKPVIGLRSEENGSNVSEDSSLNGADPLQEGKRLEKQCANCPHRSSFEVDLDADTQVDSVGSLAADQFADQSLKEAEVESPAVNDQGVDASLDVNVHSQGSDRGENLRTAAKSIECPQAVNQVAATQSKRSGPVEADAFASKSEPGQGVEKDVAQVHRFEDDSTEAPDSNEEMLVAEGREVVQGKVRASREVDALKLDKPAGWISAVRTRGETSIDDLRPNGVQATGGQGKLGEERVHNQTKETPEQERTRVLTNRSAQRGNLSVEDRSSPSGGRHDTDERNDTTKGSNVGEREAGQLEESAQKQKLTSPGEVATRRRAGLTGSTLQSEQAERREGASAGSGGQEKRKRTSTLTLFKEAAQWVSTEEGKRFAEEAKEQICEEGGVAVGGSKKPKMAKLSTLAGMDCERAGDGVVTPQIPAEQNEDTAAPECGDVAAESKREKKRDSRAQKQEELRRELRLPLESVGRETSKAEEDPKGVRSLRIVGSDSLTEQQSELPFSETEAAEMQEGPPEDVQTEVPQAAGDSDKIRGDSLDGLKEQHSRASQKRIDADSILNRSCKDASEPKTSETSLRKESERMGSKGFVQPVATKSPGVGDQRLTKGADSNSGKTSEPDENGTWFSKFVNKLSSPFKAQPTTGFKPLELVRSDQVVSNAQHMVRGPVLDTTGKAKPRNKSWPVWSGPTSNAKLEKPGGSARKASLQKVKSPLPEARRQSGEATELGRDRNRALESQAQRLGHFEESEAVKDWPIGDFLVPSTPPDSAGEATPPESRKIEARSEDEVLTKPVHGQEQVPQQGLEPQGLRPVCCIEQPGGPVLWSVIRSVGQETKLAVCVEAGKARRSIFVYSLCQKETDWTVEVQGEIAGEIRTSKDDEQVSDIGPFLEFCPDGQVLVVTSALHLTGLSSGEAANKKPCIRLLTLVDQKPQILARLDCASPSSCLVTVGSSTLAAGGEQGVVECWTMKPDWRSYEEKWVLPVARYRGVTFSAIQQLLHVPGRPHQLLGCAENGSFALWDVQQRTLLSTCHSKHILLTSAHVLCGPPPVHTNGHMKSDGGVNTLQAAHTDKNEDGVNTLYLLLRATARSTPEKGASCLAALLKGDQVAVGKELLVAEKATHVATLGSTAVAADNEGRFLLWNALTGKTTALINDLQGSSITSISVDARAALLVVGAQDSRVLIYSRLQVLQT